MKKTLLTAILFTLIAFSAAAQNNNGNQRQRRQRMDPTEMHTRQAERLIKEMKLDKEKEDLFKVLYLDYQTARQNALDPKGENKEEEAIDYKALTDEKAKELIEKQLATQEAQNKIDREYYTRFLDIITPTQAAQIFLQRQMRANRQGFEGQRGGFGGPGRGFGGQGGGFGGPGGFGGGGF